MAEADTRDEGLHGRNIGLKAFGVQFDINAHGGPEACVVGDEHIVRMFDKEFMLHLALLGIKGSTDHAAYAFW